MASDIYYYPEEYNAAVETGRMAERWYKRHSQVFDFELTSRQPVILCANSPDFRSTTVIPGDLDEGTGAVTEPLRRRVVMPLAGSLAETDHVLGHELVHAFQYDLTWHINPRGGAGLSAMDRLPLWFIEGMAEYLSLGPIDPNTAMWMRDAVRSRSYPELRISTVQYFPYRWGRALWAYIGGRWGDAKIADLLRAAARLGDVNRAIQAVLGVKSDDLSRRWHKALYDAYEPVLQLTEPADRQAHVLTPEKKKEFGALNVSPAVSPDVKYVMFFSSRDPLSIDVYLANGQTGKIIRKIIATALNPHIDSLEFVNSAGGWSADSRFFAFGAIAAGRPEVQIYDVRTDKTTQKIPLRELGEILSLSWSPDGKQMVVSAIAGGVSDRSFLTSRPENSRR